MFSYSASTDTGCLHDMRRGMETYQNKTGKFQLVLCPHISIDFRTNFVENVLSKKKKSLPVWSRWEYDEHTKK